MGIEGILVRKKNLYRLVLSMNVLGKSAAVEIDAFLMERLNPISSGYEGIGHAPAPTDVRPRIAPFVNG
jgi:hypothetical protein